MTPFMNNGWSKSTKSFMIFMWKTIKCRKKGNQMDKKKIKSALAKGIVKTLNVTLHMDANSTSCAVIYQPKAPKDLSKYRKIR